MQILRAKIQNIFSIGEIDINLASRGLTLVSGYSKDENDPNGSGKSSLAHKAITWGLWGETVIGAKADKVIKSGEKTASVEIDFLGRDGTAWRVNRSRGPNKLRLRSIHLDTGEPIEDHSCKLAKETQEKINVCLGRDFQTWVQTDFFGQGRKLAFPELTPAARYKVLEEILPIEEISEWVAYTREQKNMMQTLLRNTMHEYQQAKIRYEEEVLALTRITTSKNQWDDHQEAKILGLQTKVQAYDKSVEKVQLEIETHEQSLKNLDFCEDHLTSIKLREELVAPQLEEADIKEGEAARMVEQWQLRADKLQGKQRETKEICTECGNRLTEPQLVVIREVQESVLIELESATSQVEAARKAEKYWKSQWQTFKATWDLIESEKASHELDREFKRDRECQILGLQVKLDEKYRSNLLEQLHEQHHQSNPHAQTYANAFVQKERWDITSKKTAKLQKNYEKETLKLEFWEKAFNVDIRTALLSQVCDFLNSKSNKFMRELGNPQIHINFSTTKEQASGSKEEFNVEVTSDSGANEYDLLSGGEQSLASFSIGLALAELAASQSTGASSFMVLDEPFTNLGPTNCDRLVQFLSSDTVLGAKETVLIISNESTLKDLISNTIEVEKHNGTTRLVA